MSDHPRYANLRDYLGLLRRQRWVVLAITALFAGAAFLYSNNQTPEYRAAAAVQFRDVAQDVTLLGVSVLPENAGERAAVRAEAIASPRYAREARWRLDTKLPAGALSAAVTARVETLTNLVSIEAAWDNPKFAAAVANAFATTAVKIAERQQFGRIDAAISELEQQVRSAGSSEQEQVRASVARQQLGELRALRAVARPADVARRALPPAAPSSPKPVRNAIVAGLLGLAIGLLAAFVRDSLDRRVRSPKEAHEALGLPVLGRIGSGALGSAGLAGNGGKGLGPGDLEAFRMLRTNLAFFDAGDELRTVLVTSGVPEEGKSTVAASLASAAAAAGQRTLLVECDLRRPAIASRLGIEAQPGLSEYLAGAATPQQILQVREFAVAPSVNGSGPAKHSARRLVCIAAGSPPAQPAELLLSERFNGFLEKVSKAYDLVIIDSSPMLSAVDPLELIPLVDCVIVCVRLGLTTRDDMRAVNGALQRLPTRPTGLVVTGMGGDDDEYAYYGHAVDA